MDMNRVRELMRQRGIKRGSVSRPVEVDAPEEHHFYVSAAGTIHERGCQHWRNKNLKTTAEVHAMEGVSPCGRCIPPGF